MGFLLFIIIIFQILSGILIALHYTSDINHSYYSVMDIFYEVYYGWCLRYIHSSGASFVLLMMYFHISRALYIKLYFYITNLWLSGIVLFIFLKLIAFLGYIYINLGTDEFVGWYCHHKSMLFSTLYNCMNMWRILCV